MRSSAVAVLLLVLAACGGGGSDDSPTSSSLSAEDAVQATCKEVRAGIDEFNRQDYAATVSHFEKARVPATAYAAANDEPEADALLDAVEYYAELAPADYPAAAATSARFARNKAITLNQCASAEPIDETPTTPATPV